jgi:hypothetical protein
LRVQNSPRNAEPEFPQFVEESGEVATAIGSEKPRDVFQEHPFRTLAFQDFEKSESERASRSCEPCSFSRDGEILAREPPGIDFGIRNILLFYLHNIPKIRNVRPMRREYRGRVRIDFREGDRLDPCAFEAEVESADAAKKARVAKRHFAALAA